MNSNDFEGGKYSVIIPKARRPIHSKMVSYGLKNNSTVETVPHGNEATRGEDQVDANMMSKMACPVNPLEKRKKQLKRADSSSGDQDYTEEEENSEDSEDEEPDISKSSYTSSLHEDNSYQSNHVTLASSIIGQQNHIGSLESSKVYDEGSGNITMIICIVVVALAAVCYLYLGSNIIGLQHKATQTENRHDVVFESNMNKLKQTYNVDDDSILKLKTGISTIFSRMDTGSFMFVYNSKTDNFDTVQFDRFINEVAITAAKYLRVTPVQHTVVLSSALEMREHGELISRYRDDVDRSGVMLVKEVGALPSELAMAFHYYCDEYDPLVKRSAVLFTLNAANCSDSDNARTTHEFIEKCLARKWKTVPTENMRPLLTRIVDIIIDVTRFF